MYCYYHGETEDLLRTPDCWMNDDGLEVSGNGIAGQAAATWSEVCQTQTGTMLRVLSFHKRRRPSSVKPVTPTEACSRLNEA
jgi:hypothetical protein